VGFRVAFFFFMEAMAAWHCLAKIRTLQKPVHAKDTCSIICRQSGDMMILAVEYSEEVGNFWNRFPLFVALRRRGRVVPLRKWASSTRATGATGAISSAFKERLS